MSIAMINWVWNYSRTKGAHRLLLLALADQANDQGVCWPSKATLSKRVNCTRDWIDDLLADLVAMAAVQIEARRIEADWNDTNRYHLTCQPEQDIPLSELPSQRRRKKNSAGGREAGLPGGREAGLPGGREAGLPGGREAGLPGGREAGLPAGGRRASPKPPVNHHLNHQEEEGTGSKSQTPLETITDLLIIMTGLKPSQTDLAGLHELAEIGATAADIHAAIQWRHDQGLAPVRQLGKLFNGIKINRAMRAQAEIAAASPPAKDYTAGLPPAEPARLEDPPAPTPGELLYDKLLLGIEIDRMPKKIKDDLRHATPILSDDGRLLLIQSNQASLLEARAGLSMRRSAVGIDPDLVIEFTNVYP